MIEQSTHRRERRGVEVGGLRVSERDEALGVMVRGMRDNPLHVAVFGTDTALRERRLRRLFDAAFTAMSMDENMLVARDEDDAIVGVCGALAPGACKPKPAGMARLMAPLLASGPRAALRTLRWMGAWAGHDPEERHWHLGPVAVDAHLQGMGIGSMLMSVFRARMDAAGEDAYLETDREINIHFYERFGFETVAEENVLGTPNWFMTRRAQAR
jgi:ribosomal protein S18 acetylase RimI-like enzyme